MDKLLIYIAGPLGIENNKYIIKFNIQNVVEIGRIVRKRKHIPFIPHFFYYGYKNHGYPIDDENAIDLCCDMVKKCDGLIRLEGDSPGSEKEIKTAQDHHIPSVKVETIKLPTIWQAIIKIESFYKNKE